MKAIKCIFGVLSILGAFYCMFFPGLTFLDAGWIVAILLGVYGICSIVGYFTNSKKKEKTDNGNMIADGIVGLIVGIAAAVISVLALFSTSVFAMLDLIILLIFAFWLLYSGVSSIMDSVKQKKSGGKMWVLSLILGIVLILTGIYGATHLLFAAFSIGYIIGFELMIYGIRLITSAFENK